MNAKVVSLQRKKALRLVEQHLTHEEVLEIIKKLNDSNFRVSAKLLALIVA